jgi:hypothetical protein
MDHGDLSAAAAQDIGSRDSTRWLADDQNNLPRSAVGECIPHRSRSSTSSQNPRKLCMNFSIIECAFHTFGVSICDYRTVDSEHHCVGNAQEIDNWFTAGNQPQNGFLERHRQ